jgi:cell division protein FtsB
MPKLQLHMGRRARVVAKLRARLPKPSSPVPALVGLVSRWRGGRAALSLEHRRARTMLGAAVVLPAVILLTSFPLSAVLSQRAALSSTARELTTVQAENQSLGRQASQLAAPSTLNELARHDFGFVPTGDRVYNVLPATSPSGSASSGSSGSSGSSSSSLGPDQVPLNGPPVVPGSLRSQALIGVVGTGGSASEPRTGPGTSGGAAAGPSGEPRSYWGRVVRSLEFWN